jgi:hypothetical protein
VRDTRGVRATGLQGDVDTEIIEILDDDSNAFGDHSYNTTINDDGGPRWIAPMAVAALVALIGYGVATSASEGAPKVAPAPSTTAPVPTTTLSAPTTVPVTTIADPPPPVPYYDADLPREFSIQFAELEDEGVFDRSSDYQLWATPDATASSGSWFSIESREDGSTSVYAVEAYRVQAGEQSIAISRTITGQSVVQFSAESTSIMVTSFGWTDENLVRLAQSITVNGGDVSVSDPSLIAGHQLISTVPPWLAVRGISLERIYYASKNDVDGGVGLLVAPRQRADEGGATLDRQIALRFTLDNPTEFEVDGHVAVAGPVVSLSDYSLATWIAGDHIVTMSGFMPAPELITLARTVHKVTKDQWDGMKFQAARHNSDNNFGEYKSSPAMPVDVGTDAESKPWLIQAAMATFPNQQQVTWQWTGNEFTTEADKTARINTVVDGTRTYVLANLPRAVSATGQLLINRTGFDPVVVEFSDTDPSLDRTLAAYVFSEAAPYTAQIVGADGAVLATWPS